MDKRIAGIVTGLLLACCQNSTDSHAEKIVTSDDQKNIQAPGKTIGERFTPPEGFVRKVLEENSFGTYLRSLSLKEPGESVKYYNGAIKPNNKVYEAVIDLPIGTRDLHQCADAVMRLRAEYLYNKGDYKAIHFNFTNGFRVDYSEWMKGKRVIVQGNKCRWEQKTSPSNTYSDFWQYMETVFTYAGTLSLSKELKKVDVDSIMPGDVFIRGGSPGHAVVVVDLAIDTLSGEKIFMLAQSYMPAQEIQILMNPSNRQISPWYSSRFGDVLETPEWTFRKDELMRFADE